MNDTELSFQCAYPIQQYPFITMAHGAGGRLTQALLDQIFYPAFQNPHLAQQHDGAHLTLSSTKLAITTDSYVVTPLFFPGSDIGTLAITGTINDLAMCGAKPLYLTCGFILTEGLSIQTLINVVDSIRKVALQHQVQIVAGDIKVVEKTHDGGLYINTTGIGELSAPTTICPQHIQAGDAIIISGDIGRHGLAVLGQRGNFHFEPPIASDCAVLWPMVQTLLSHSIVPHCLRDLTRGGLAGALIELANTTSLSFEITEKDIPVSQSVHAASELLGLDPLYIANEGRMVLFIPKECVMQTIALLKQFPEGENAAHIGYVLTRISPKGTLLLKTRFGSQHQLTAYSGEQLPRIC